MIIRLTEGEREVWEDYVLCLRTRPTLAEVLDAANAVDNSYAAELTTMLFEHYVEAAVDLKHDYAMYFVREYGTVERYLRGLWRFDARVRRAVAAAWEGSQIVLLSSPSRMSIVSGQEGADLLARLFESEGGT